MKVGFVIVNYNDSSTTIELLQNISSYAFIDKIVIVDNDSKDQSLCELKKYETNKIVVLKAEMNKGYGSGINIGSKYLIDLYGSCKIIISNSDIVIDKEDDLKALCGDMPKDCAIIAPVIKEHHGISRGWKCPTPMQDALLNLPYIHKFLRPRILGYKESDYDKPLTHVDIVSGCFFVMNSDDLQSIDFFDEHIFLYYEENMIHSKLKAIDKKIMIDNELSVFHNHSVSINKSLNQMNKYKALKKSQYYFHVKYQKANFIERLFLKITIKISYNILYLYHLVKN